MTDDDDHILKDRVCLSMMVASVSNPDGTNPHCRTDCSQYAMCVRDTLVAWQEIDEINDPKPLPWYERLFSQR